MRNKRRELTCGVKKIDLQEGVLLGYHVEVASVGRASYPRAHLMHKIFEQSLLALRERYWLP